MIDYVVSVLTIATIAGVLALGLNVRWGWAGEFDLSYYAFAAIGAYMGGALAAAPASQSGGTWIFGVNGNFVISLLLAMISSAALSAALGAIALWRLRGDYFAITTIAFTLILTSFISQEPALFNGYVGLYAIGQPLQSVILDPTSYGFFYLGLCLVVLAIVYFVLELLYKSPFGRTLRIVREDEIAAMAFGRNVFRARLKAFTLGGAVAGVGGFLFATYLTSWSPGSWGAIETFLLYTAIFLGGQANSRGVILGTFIVIGVLPEITRFLPEVPGHSDLFPAIRNIAVGVLLILILRWRPQGIFPEARLRDHDDDADVGEGSSLNPTIASTPTLGQVSGG